MRSVSAGRPACGATRGLTRSPIPSVISGQSSALVNAISAAPGKPTFGPRPFECGVRNRPTLMQNVETLARLALIARHGPGWFRQLGTLRDPGSTLVTLSGAINRCTRFAVGLGERDGPAGIGRNAVASELRVSREDNSLGRISRSFGVISVLPR